MHVSLSVLGGKYSVCIESLTLSEWATILGVNTLHTVVRNLKLSDDLSSVVQLSSVAYWRLRMTTKIDRRRG